MKIRIGIGLGRGGAEPDELANALGALERHGFDSLWLSEVLTGSGPDPLVGLAWLAARSERSKLGTTMLFPGRNLLRLAKGLATLDRLSEGRLLVTFVPGLLDSPEREAIGLEPKLRGAAIDEGLPLLRRLLAGEVVSSDSELARFPEFELPLRPVQAPLEFWLGGLAPAALERCGRLGDGWLPSGCTPEEVVEGRRVIEDVARRFGREISPEHFGVSLAYAHSEEELAGARSRRRDGRQLTPIGLEGLRLRLLEFIAVGCSKFVVRPLRHVGTWDEELGELAEAVGGLQS